MATTTPDDPSSGGRTSAWRELLRCLTVDAHARLAELYQASGIREGRPTDPPMDQRVPIWEQPGLT